MDDLAILEALSAIAEGEAAEALSVSFNAPADYERVFEEACRPLRKLASALEALLPRGSTLPVSVARLKGKRLFKVLLACERGQCSLPFSSRASGQSPEQWAALQIVEALNEKLPILVEKAREIMRSAQRKTLTPQELSHWLDSDMQLRRTKAALLYLWRREEVIRLNEDVWIGGMSSVPMHIRFSQAMDDIRVDDTGADSSAKLRGCWGSPSVQAAAGPRNLGDATITVRCANERDFHVLNLARFSGQTLSATLDCSLAVGSGKNIYRVVNVRVAPPFWDVCHCQVDRLADASTALNSVETVHWLTG